MSSLLRSTKFIRCIGDATRKIILNPTNSCGNIFQNSRILGDPGISWSRDLATSVRSAEQLDPLLARLDSNIRRLGRVSRRDIDRALLQLQRADSVTAAQSLLLLRCCGEAVAEEDSSSRTELARRVWGALTARGADLDVTHYNALLKAYLDNEHEFSPAEFLEELEKKGVTPNRVTYQRLVWRYCRAGDLEGATRILEKMRELSLPVSEPVLNAMVMGHASSGDPEAARAVVQTMAGAGLRPSNRTYTLLACGYAKSGDLKGVRDVLTQCSQTEICITNRDLMDIIETLTVNGHGEHVDEFLQQAEKSIGYNQDALNLILKLINTGHDDVALKVYRTMTSASPTLENSDAGMSSYKGAFFVRQLVKAGRSSEVLIGTCKMLQSEGLVPKALIIAAESALEHGQIATARDILNEFKAAGLPIRVHYFWPLLANATNEEGSNVLDILRMMQNDFSIAPSGETLRDYVLPKLRKNNNAGEVVLLLRSVGISATHASRNVIVDSLEAGELKSAAEIALEYRPRGRTTLIGQPLIQCLIKTKDINSFVNILHVIAGNDTKNTENVDETAENSAKEVGRIVFNATKRLGNDLATIDKLFSALLEKGLGITNEWAERIQNTLGDNLNAEISEKLSNLTSEDLELQPLAQNGQKSRQQSWQSLESILAQAKARGSNVNALYRQLISAYTVSGEKDKLKELLTQLESEKFVLTAGTLANLTDFFSQNGEIETALKYKEQLKLKEPDFVLDEVKVIRIALALVKADRFDEALKLIVEEKRGEIQNKERPFVYNNLCWQLLNHAAEKGEVEQVKKLFDALIEHKYAEVSNILLGSLIKVHLTREDFPGALKAFEEAVRTHRCTPWKVELMRRLIDVEDAEKLQWVTDLSTSVHGEVNSLHDLALALVECGRVRQARRVLHTPGLQHAALKITQACQRYSQEGKVQHLEDLIEVTNGLNQIDRSEMFYQLLTSYCRADNTEKALDLWTALQEQPVPPSDKFLIHLANHLKSKNLEIPFKVPENAAKPQTKQTNNRIDDSKTDGTRKNLLKAVESAIETQNVENILKIKDSNKDFVLNNLLNTQSIELLMKEKRFVDAGNFAFDGISKGVFPKTTTFKFLVKNLATLGEGELINKLGEKLDEKLVKAVALDTKFVEARFVKGEAEAVVAELEKLISGGDVDWKAVEKRFPRSKALESIGHEPTIMERCEAIASRLSENGLRTSVNVMWIERMVSGEQASAHRLWDKHLKQANSVIFRRLLQAAHDRNDPKLLENLLEFLSTNENITPGAKGNIYSRLIDLHLKNRQLDEAKSALEQAKKSGITEDNINKTALNRLSMAEQGEFPTDVTEKDERN